MSNESAKNGYALEAALEHLQRIQSMQGNRPWRLVIRKYNPGAMSGHQTTEVQAIAAGFDWEAGQVVIEPAKPLTELTPEQVTDISKSVRASGSWHAYQSQKKLRDQIDSLKARIKELEALSPEMLAALQAARGFIVNGTELGYIRMPDADCPDPAHNTLPTIEAAIARAQALKAVTE